MTVRHAYVHVPFCGRRCSYCDFSIAVRRSVPVGEYLEALSTELSSAPSGIVDTVYLGGGTPSRLGGDGVRRLLDVVRERYEPASGAEITLEANPEDLTLDAANAWLRAGVNRLSIGAQSFEDSVLRWMHRLHDAASTRRAVENARQAGFDNISLDLIFALPLSVNRDWIRDLDTAISLQPDHISLYGLTVEPATPLFRWRDRGAVVEAPDERYEREYLHAHSRLTAAGYEHYEVSNFGRPGFASRHNQAYWTLRPYAGHGPAAHRFTGDVRAWNEPAYARWVERLRRGEEATAGSEVLTPEQRDLEVRYLGLRTLDGVETDVSDGLLTDRWVAEGWARRSGGRLILTPTGWLRLDALTSVLTGDGSPCNL